MSTHGVSTDAKAAARFMNNYARGYHAGAFATPTAAEIAKLQATPGGWREWDGVMAACRTLTRDSVRTDFIGRQYTLRKGSTVVTHLAAARGAHLPAMSWADAVYAYTEDSTVTGQLQDQGREPRAVRISAASEVITCWGHAGTGYVYPREDVATIVRVPLDVSPMLRQDVLNEVERLTGWHDDFPFYSDGSWSALSLRGFNPKDPQWGIKPSEMSKSWWAEHPEAKRYTHADWTTLAAMCPATVGLVKGFMVGSRLERVRFLQMSSRNGKAATLSRHTDITDRAAGTRDGAIARFHIPLITDPSITMSGWNLKGRTRAVHLPAWSCWYLDARKPHSVVNPSGVDRIHLVIDVVADAHARQAIVNGQEYVR
jgi:hypothetical protein